MGVDSCAQCYKINIFLSLHLYKEPSWAATVDDAAFTQLHHSPPRWSGTCLPSSTRSPPSLDISLDTTSPVGPQYLLVFCLFHQKRLTCPPLVYGQCSSNHSPLVDIYNNTSTCVAGTLFLSQTKTPSLYGAAKSEYCGTRIEA
jgi:hypothetical protein